MNTRPLARPVAALDALSASSKSGSLDTTEAAQHVATCMLLCALEVSCPNNLGQKQDIGAEDFNVRFNCQQKARGNGCGIYGEP